MPKPLESAPPVDGHFGPLADGLRANAVWHAPECWLRLDLVRMDVPRRATRSYSEPMRSGSIG